MEDSADIFCDFFFPSFFSFLFRKETTEGAHAGAGGARGRRCGRPLKSAGWWDARERAAGVRGDASKGRARPLCVTRERGSERDARRPAEHAGCTVFFFLSACARARVGTRGHHQKKQTAHERARPPAPAGRPGPRPGQVPGRGGQGAARAARVAGERCVFGRRAAACVFSFSLAWRAGRRA